MRNLTFVRHKVKHYPHLWLKVKTRSPPTHADGVSHPKIGHFGQYFDAWRCGMKAGESRQAEPKKRPGRKICEATLLSKGAFRRIGSCKGKVT